LHKRTRPLFAWIGVFIAAGGVFLFAETVTVLSVGQEGAEPVCRLKVAPSEPITLFHTNSIYDAAVEEVLEVRSGALVLKTVRTDSPAVLEYYGFDGPGAGRALDRPMGSTLSIRMGMRQDQGFRIGRRTVHLHTIAPPGNGIRLTVNRVSGARFLWWRLLGRTRPDPSAAP
jgi:hypothetical protein